MVKRPNLLANVDLGQGEAPPLVPVASVQIGQPTNQQLKRKIVKTSVYLDPEINYKLKEIALVKHCKVHDLFIDGINHVLKKNGHPTIRKIVP